MRLKELVNETVHVLREVKACFKNPCQLWSTGKDSTLLLYLTRNMFREVPWPVVHIDTGKKFKEIYAFRDRLAEEWNLDLLVAKNSEADRVSPSTVSRFKCCMKLKTEVLRRTIEQYGFDAVLVSIRRDEHGIRNKERIISPRSEDFTWNYFDQPLELSGWGILFTDYPNAHHVRVHPLLNWTLEDVWRYTMSRKIPVNPLYLKGFTSLGCEPCTKPTMTPSKNLKEYVKKVLEGVAERGGRAQDKEESFIMQRLRAMGYM